MTRKIILISPSLKVGGIERVLTILANYFDKKGHEVVFLSCSKNSPFFTLNESIKVIMPPYQHKGGIVTMFTYYPRLLFYIRKNVKDHKPDVVMTFGEYLNPIVLLSLMGIEVPIYISDRSSPDYRFRALVNIIIGIGRKLLYTRSAGFIAQTQRYADHINRYFNNKLNVRIIPNPVKEVKIFPVLKKHWILSVGRLSFEKGHDRLLTAFSFIKEKSDWKLVFAGDGPMLEGLKSMCKDMKIEGDVEFLGKVQDIDSLLSESSIFVLPSRLEGFPNSLCEALASGLPSLCFDCIPGGDVITNGYDGYIIPDGDVIMMADKIKFLMDNPVEREKLSINAIKIKERLSIDRIGDLFLAFILNNVKKS